MSGRLQERERIGAGETVRLFAEALGYLGPFRGRMTVKVALTLLSLLPGLLLPFPIKILIDHVVLEQPGQRYPLLIAARQRQHRLSRVTAFYSQFVYPAISSCVLSTGQDSAERAETL